MASSLHMYEEMEKQADEVIIRASTRRRRPTTDLKTAREVAKKMQRAIRRYRWYKIIKSFSQLSFRRTVLFGVDIYPIRDREKELLGYEGCGGPASSTLG